MAAGATIRSYLDQNIELRAIMTLKLTIFFPRLSEDAEHRISVTVFSDAGRSATNGQL